jgi:hypothetical protein
MIISTQVKSDAGFGRDPKLNFLCYNYDLHAHAVIRYGSLEDAILVFISYLS